MIQGLIDTHAHFNATEPQRIRDDLNHAWRAGLAAVVAVGGNERLNDGACAAALAGDGRVYAAIGCDRDVAAQTPTERIESVVADLSATVERATKSGVRVVALGEMGMDLHYRPDSEQAQSSFFREELALAASLSLPVVVHSRNAVESTLSALEWYVGRLAGGLASGVLHCYTYDAATVARFTELGFYVSFSGIVTFRAADALREAAKATPLDRLLIETDSPFLAPVPFRGSRNEPANVVHVAASLAETLAMSCEALRDLTVANALRLFGLEGVAPRRAR